MKNHDRFHEHNIAIFNLDFFPLRHSLPRKCQPEALNRVNSRRTRVDSSLKIFYPVSQKGFLTPNIITMLEVSQVMIEQTIYVPMTPMRGSEAQKSNCQMFGIAWTSVQDHCLFPSCCHERLLSRASVSDLM